MKAELFGSDFSKGSVLFFLTSCYCSFLFLSFCPSRFCFSSLILVISGSCFILVVNAAYSSFYLRKLLYPVFFASIAYHGELISTPLGRFHLALRSCDRHSIEGYSWDTVRWDWRRYWISATEKCWGALNSIYISASRRLKNVSWQDSGLVGRIPCLQAMRSKRRCSLISLEGAGGGAENVIGQRKLIPHLWSCHLLGIKKMLSTVAHLPYWWRKYEQMWLFRKPST